MFHNAVSLAGMVGVCWATFALAEEPRQSPREWLEAFSQNWREADWRQKAGPRTVGYMRCSGDEGWRARMRAMQRFVQRGGDSIPLLLETLKTGGAPQRILAAQTLGYLGPDVPAEPLVAALESEADPAVRLYLVDALRMLGKGDAIDWDDFLDDEPNRDVRRHVAYVQERADKPLDEEVVATLKAWDYDRVESAAVGERAPDFVLQSAQGKPVRLGDFRGKQAVVLVFIYGDT